ncbi:hypothetical protein [Neobacillus vireti]|uniref:hypothetical protein n=1 Tax=Neobacillus vireti TaxID=220686 RepID=UPI002FFDB81B
MGLKETRIYEYEPDIEVRTVIKGGKRFFYNYRDNVLIKKVLDMDLRENQKLKEAEAYLKQTKIQQKKYKK